jgi:hypothetical protein
METTVRIIVCDDEITAVQRVVKELKHFFHNANIETVFFPVHLLFRYLKSWTSRKLPYFFGY